MEESVVEVEIVAPIAKVKGFGVRHGQVFLHFFFYVVLSGIESSLAIAIATIHHPLGGKNKIFFNHSINEVTTALSTYVIGFMMTILFGGWTCKRFGFKRPMITMMTIISAVSLLLPYISEKFELEGVKVCRLIQGLCAGIIFPMPADFINKWIPVSERTTLGTTIYTSSIFANLLVVLVFPIGVSSTERWSFIFDIYGYLAIVWVILMALFGADSPEKYPRTISEDEVKYILENRGKAKSETKVQIPWIKLLTSFPVWAIIIAQIGSRWLLLVLSSNIPIMMRLYFNVKSTGGIPIFICLITWLLSFAISRKAQSLIKHGKITTFESRKKLNSMGSWIPAVCVLLFILRIRGSQYLGVGVWTIISVASVGTIIGPNLNQNDISSNFSSVIYGFGTFAGILFSVIFSSIFDYFLLYKWNLFFILTAIILALTNAFFLKFGSGDEQEWDEDNNIEDGMQSSSTKD